MTSSTRSKRSHKQHSSEADKPNGDGGRDSVSVAKMGMIGTIGGAIVTAITTIVLGFTHDDGSAATTTSAGQTIKPKLDNTSPLGSFDEVAINESGTAVTVTGSAQKDVDSVVVLIGPRQSGGQYWAASANVVNQQWKLSIATEPHIPVPYEIKAYYRQQAGATPVQGASYITFSTFQRPAATPTTTPPPPAPVVNCAEQIGDPCFNGPGWGPPSVYHSGQ